MANATAAMPGGGTAESAGIAVRNPRTGEVLYTVAKAPEERIGEAYARARGAAPALAAMPAAQRMAELGKVKRYLLEKREHVVDCIVRETGKSRTEAMLTEVFPSLDLIQYYERNAERILRDERHPTPLVLLGKRSKVYYEPLGTVLIISPWNYPFNLSMTPIVTALAAGNTVVFKPSEYTPLQGLLEEIFEESGFLKDAVQVVYGGKETGQALIEHKPDKIFFTGSEGAGKAIMARAAQDLIPVELELGGKDPMVVFDDVNLNRAVNGAVWGSMTNCGQTCTSVERIYVQEGLYEDFVREFKKTLGQINYPNPEAGPYDDREGDMGCMTAPFQVEKVKDQVADAQAKGATIECGGMVHEGTQAFAPTAITGVTPEMKIYREETFGPVATITPFKDEAEAVRLANDSPYGLSASVWSRDLERADRVARQIATGSVSINNVLATQGNAALPFGGVKHSGIGRYKGAHGLYSFSNIKSIMVDRDSGRYEPIWYPYGAGKCGLISKLVAHSFSGGLMGLLRTMAVGVKLELLAKKRHL